MEMFNVDIERGLLASVLFNNNKMDDLQLLTPEVFYVPFYQEVFSIMQELYKEDSFIDDILIAEILKEKNKLDESALFEIISTSPIEPVESYVEVLLSHYQKRKLLHTSSKLKKLTFEENVEDIISKTTKDLEEISSLNVTKFKNIDFYIQKLEEQMKNSKELGSDGYKSGIYTLDGLVSFSPGDLVVVAARPSMGKTSFATTLTEHNLKLGNGVIFDSLEMPGEKIMQRCIAAYSKNPLSSIKKGELIDFNAYKQAVDFYKQSKLYLQDESYITIHKLKANALKLLRNDKSIKFWIIDHLRYIKKPGQNIANEISEITKELKKIAKEYGIVVVLLSQLNRENEKSATKKPTLAGIRESGAVEEDADIVIGLHRESYYKRNESQKETPVNEAELIVLKNRDGQAGVAKCFFNGPLAKFQNYNEVTIKEVSANDTKMTSMPII